MVATKTKQNFKLKEISKNIRKNTQNSRKKLNFLAFLESFDVKNMSKKYPGCFYALSHPFIRFRGLYMLSYIST